MAEGKGAPNGETILRLLLAIVSVEDMHGFVQKHLPHLTPYTKALTEFGGKIAKPFAVTRKHCEVLLELSFNPCTRERLVDKFGLNAEPAVQDLIAIDLVACADGVCSLTANDIYVASQQFAIELSRLMLDNLDINRKGNMILSHSATLSLEAAREIYRIMEKAQNDALKILKNPENNGNERVAVSLAMTMY